MTAALWRLLRALQRISCVAKITLTRHQQSAKRRACAKFSATVHNEQHLLRGTRGAALRTGDLGGQKQRFVRESAERLAPAFSRAEKQSSCPTGREGREHGSDVVVNDEIGHVVELGRLAVDDRQPRSVALGEHREPGRGPYHER